jgi:hypothetical protein
MATRTYGCSYGYLTVTTDIWPLTLTVVSTAEQLAAKLNNIIPNTLGESSTLT